MIKRFIRAGAFVSKEINEVRRQPRLILALILGPFLILLLFGIGYKGRNDSLKAIIIVPATGDYSVSPDEYKPLTGDQITITEVTTNRDAALERLRHREVDIVVQVPQDIGATISSGSQVALPVYLNEVDPLRRDAITYLTYFAANEINKQTVAAAAGQGQEGAGDVRSAIVRMRNALDAIEQHMARGEVQEANRQVRDLQGSSANTQLAVALMAQFMAADTTIVKPAEPQDPNRVNLADGQQVANRVAGDIQNLSTELNKSQPDQERVRTGIAGIRSDLDMLDKLTQQFQRINPLVLAAPFYAKPENTAPTNVSFINFYGPGVLVLLLQHIGITLAALSMVRERLFGTVELFRVSPTSAGEIMAGKYVSFTLLLGAITSVLLLVISNDLQIEGFPLSLGVPILGDWLALTTSIALVIFASIGLGFFIAAISKTESQAVQISMLVLLTSVFFGGFFLSLETLLEPVRAVSYALPVTYGISLFQDVMLRGVTPDTMMLLWLLVLGVGFALVSYLLFRRQFRRG
ncbi:MAG TPA: ABC transporter permease [Chloroflexia bacterium]|nr:ABC transporter permease [Chloroflexia bacterium]